ncbi:MAG: peptidase T [Eubacteriales bacterium]|nr:peptidase T [Eubacteriales bacterium]
MKAYERFLNYVKVHTTSDDYSDTAPTTSCQFDLAKMLVKEMQNLGLHNVRLDEKCYVYGEIPATAGCEDKVSLGFIAHMDTTPDFCGKNIKPQIIDNYNGKDLPLGNSGRMLSTKYFPHLSDLKGRTLITTDGTTLLGADNKAGIAEILTACEHILNGNKPHGRIAVAFTPDEEVGKGADGFDVKDFGCDFAYTVDGGYECEIEYENFNGCDAKFEIQGINVHPGTAKNVMINASLLAMEINSLLPGVEIPGYTEEYEGFYHLTRMEGTVEKAKLEYIVRDHSKELYEIRKNTLKHIAKIMNEKYGEETVNITITDRYANMAELIKPHFHLIENAESAIRKIGLKPIVKPIRGGTDGARLSYMGLPCPNLGTGGYGFHGPYEHITAEGMEVCVSIIQELIKIYSEYEH